MLLHLVPLLLPQPFDYIVAEELFKQKLYLLAFPPFCQQLLAKQSSDCSQQTIFHTEFVLEPSPDHGRHGRTVTVRGNTEEEISATNNGRHLKITSVRCIGNIDQQSINPSIMPDGLLDGGIIGCSEHQQRAVEIRSNVRLLTPFYGLLFG